MIRSACARYAALFLFLVGCGTAAPPSQSNEQGGGSSGGSSGASNQPSSSGKGGGSGSGVADAATPSSSGTTTGSSSSGAGGASAGADAAVSTPPSDAGSTTPQKKGSLKFVRKDLNKLNLAEATTFGDYNKDGHVDVMSGPYWWEGPTFDKEHQLAPPSCTAANPGACNCYTCTSLGDWAEYSYDVDGDGWIDTIHVSRPGNPSYWYKNPGMPAVETDMNWPKSLIATLSWEQSAFVDMAGKGVPGLVGVTNGGFGWLDPGTNSPWTFHMIGGAGGLWEHKKRIKKNRKN